MTERQKQLVYDLRWIYAADMTFYRVGLELYRRNHPDFMTVYLRGTDEISHRYWDIDMPGGTFSPPLTDAEYQWMKNLIPNYYVFTDRLIGGLLKEADAQTNVVLRRTTDSSAAARGSWPTSSTGSCSCRAPA